MARAARPPRGEAGEPGARVGTVTAARSLAEDVNALVRAEVALARAELLAGVRPKALGAGLLAAAGVLVALAGLGLLLAIGFVLSEVAGLPGWASAVIVSGALLLAALGLALAGRAKLRTELGLDTTKRSLQEDVTWAREHLKGT